MIRFRRGNNSEIGPCLIGISVMTEPASAISSASPWCSGG